MKKLLLLAIPALLISCGPKEYTISGNASGEYEGKQVLLVDNEGATTDSCIITDGAFAFAGSVDDQDIYIISMDRTRIPVFVQNGAKITASLTDGPAIVSDNGGLNDIYATVNNKINESSQALNEKAQSLINKGMTYTEVHDSVKADIEALYDVYRNGMTENKDNIVGAYILGMLANELYSDLNQLDSVMAEVKYASQIKAINELREFLMTAETTKEGKMFVDFTGYSIDGTTASKLSDYVGKGKYVLVDFWASWCGPCKMEIPNLVELHKQFGGEKFTVLGINVWDSEEKFKAALEEEGIEYPQIFVPRDNKDNATELYSIRGIPQIMLFAPDGTILKRNLRGEEMKNFVADNLKDA